MCHSVHLDRKWWWWCWVVLFFWNRGSRCSIQVKAVTTNVQQRHDTFWEMVLSLLDRCQRPDNSAKCTHGRLLSGGFPLLAVALSYCPRGRLIHGRQRSRMNSAFALIKIRIAQSVLGCRWTVTHHVWDRLFSLMDGIRSGGINRIFCLHILYLREGSDGRDPPTTCHAAALPSSCQVGPPFVGRSLRPLTIKLRLF